jgi:hypothetical protein
MLQRFVKSRKSGSRFGANADRHHGMFSADRFKPEFGREEREISIIPGYWLDFCPFPVFFFSSRVFRRVFRR